MTIDLRLSSVPVGWRPVRLGEVCAIQLGKMLSPSSKTNQNPKPYLRNANVGWNAIDLSDIYTMEFSEREAQKFELRKGDLLVCEGGEPGRAAVWGGEITPCYYQKALHRLRPIDNVDLRFIMYRLWHGALDGEFLESQAKTTIAHLPAIRLRELPISIPDLPEQRRIVAALQERLDAVAQARAAAAAQLEAARALPSSLLRSVFESDEAQQWPKVRVGEACEIVSGSTPSRSNALYWGGPIPWVAPQHLKTLRLSSSDQSITQLAVDEGRASILQPAAVLVVVRGMILVRDVPVAISEVPLSINQDLKALVPKPAVLRPAFLAYSLVKIKRRLLSQVSVAGHGTCKLETGFSLELSVPCPSVAIQDQIVSRIQGEGKAAAASGLAADGQIANLDALPQSLLRRAFSGKL